MKKSNHIKIKPSWMVMMLCLLLGTTAMAQSRIMKGVVKDNEGEPIIGATILIEGTTTGTVTNLDGEYSINLPEKASKVRFSYIGMDNKVVNAKPGVLNIVLESNTTDLEEVVVIGYGQAKKRDLTGSVASVSADKLKDIPVANAAEAITGRLAGVQVTTIEGSPDADVKIRVRGGGSITGDNTPLYIVDGFPVNSISDIAPSEIQSIDVLKDASSTAIYGSRGANGVVIITTKSPKEGKFSVNYNGTFGFKQIAKTLDVLSPYEFARAQYEQAVLDGKVEDQYNKYFGLYDDMDIYQGMAGTDWQKKTFGRTGSMMTHNVSVSGGSDKISYSASYNRTDDVAIMMDSKYSRDNLNAKFSANPLKWLKFDFSTRYSDTRVVGAGANEVNEKSSSDSRLKNSVIYSPIPLGDISSDSDQEEVLGNLYSPITAIRDNYREKNNKIYSYNGSLQITPIKNLRLKTELGIENRTDLENRYYGLSTYYVRQQATIKNAPAITIIEKDRERMRNTNTANYEFKTNSGHSFSALLGQETMITTSTEMTSLVEGLPEAFSPEDGFKFTPNGQYSTVRNYYAPDDKLVSFFGRVNYDYRGKYLISATMRADGSSIFARGNRWGYFPSVAAAWRMSDEDFMGGASDWLSNLKLRASFGTAGNNNIAPNQYLRVFTVNNTSYIESSDSYWTSGKKLYNPDLKWETTFTRNFGVDFGFWRNRLNGSIELYYNNTKDLLIEFPIVGTGYESQVRNIGATSNKGVELVLNGVILDTKKYGLDVSLNISHNKNRVESLGGLNELAAQSGWTSNITTDYKVMVGQPIGLMWGYVTEGMYTTDDFNYVNGKWVAKEGVVDNSAIAGNSWGPGALKLKDVKKDGKITTEDMTVIGNANPDFTGGFNLTGRIGNFDLSAAFTFVIGNDIYNANKIEFTSNDQNQKYRNMLSMMNSGNRFTHIDWETGQRITDAATLAKVNENANMWSGVSRFVFHSWAVEDGSFLRLNNLTLGYTLPRNLTQKWYIQQARLFATASNLFVLTNYSGYDPEVDTRRKTPLTPGVDYSAYPKSRSYNFGINLTF